MADFWSLVIGVCLAVVACSLAYGIGAFCAWFTKPRDDASDEHADWQGLGGGGFFHNGQGSTPGER